MNTFGQELKRIREEKGLTQSALAELVGITQGGVAHIESDFRSVSAEVLFSIARALGVPATHFEPFLLGEVPTTKRKK